MFFFFYTLFPLNTLHAISPKKKDIKKVLLKKKNKPAIFLKKK